MIIDQIKNAHSYYGLSSDIKECLSYLKEKQFPMEETSRFKINETCSLGIFRYRTVPIEEREWEAHDHCIDLQAVLKGKETISCASREQMQYIGTVEGKDLLRYQGKGDAFCLEEGYFCLLFPDDVHRTKIQTKHSCEVLKAIFKIALP